MAVTKAMRYQVLRRDNHTCRYCGRSAPEVKLAVDHVTPVALGGTDEASNLVTACTECNSGKAATPPDASLVGDVNALALRWTAAMKIAGQRLSEDRARRDEIRQIFLDGWNAWTYEANDGSRHTVELPISWPNSIDQIATAGLGRAEILDSVDIAMRNDRAKDTFRYFCGVCYRKIADLQAAARQVLDAEDADQAAHEDNQRFLDAMLDLAWSAAQNDDDQYALADLGTMVADQLRDYMPDLPEYTIGLVTAHTALIIWKLGAAAARDQANEPLTAIRAAVALVMGAGDLTRPEGQEP